MDTSLSSPSLLMSIISITGTLYLKCYDSVTADKRVSKLQSWWVHVSNMQTKIYIFNFSLLHVVMCFNMLASSNTTLRSV